MRRRKCKSDRPTLCGIPIDRALAFAIGVDAGNRHMDAHTLKPWNREAYNIAAETTNRLLMHVPVAEGGLKEIPIAQLIRDGLIAAPA